MAASSSSAADVKRSFLVAGATGATGKWLVRQLLDQGFAVTSVVRNRRSLPEDVASHASHTVVEGTILDMEAAALQALVDKADGLASCLGHKLNAKGIWGKPRWLVTESARRLCEAAIKAPPLPSGEPRRFVLMASAGVGKEDEKRSAGHRLVLGCIRCGVPPHRDNENAVGYLRREHSRKISDDEKQALEWCVVRPDSLIDAATVTEYTTHEAPTRDALFNSGTTSRINVADFMGKLLIAPYASDDSLWKKWRFQLPVQYNVETKK